MHSTQTTHSLSRRRSRWPIIKTCLARPRPVATSASAWAALGSRLLVIIIDAPTHGPLYGHVGCHRPMVGRVRRVNSVPPTGRGWPLQLCPSQIIPCQSPPPRPQAHTQRRHRVTSDLEEEEEGDEVEVGVGGGDGGLHGAVGRLPAHLPGQCRVAHKAALYCQLWPLWAVNQR